jgi:DNA-binding XRE family transcriptional regulator
MTYLPKPIKQSKETVTLSRREWEAYIDALDEQRDLEILQDADERRARGEDDGLPVAFVERLFAGESPVRVWREFRGLSTTVLAKRADVSQPYLSEIENGVKPGSVAALKKLAAALRVDLDDLAFKPSKPSRKVRA